MQDKKVEVLFQEQLEYYSQTLSSSRTSPLIVLFCQWVKMRKIRKKLEIAEFGGAAGQLLASLNDKYPHNNLTNIELVKEYGNKQVCRKIKFVHGSILKSDFKDKSFDCLIIRDILHHLIGKNFNQTRKNQLLALKELKRMVRPNGIILIDELTNQSKWVCKILFYLSRLNSRIGIRFNKLQISPQTIICLFTPEELSQMIKKIFNNKKYIKITFFKKPMTLRGGIVHFGRPYGKLICAIG